MRQALSLVVLWIGRCIRYGFRWLPVAAVMTVIYAAVVDRRLGTWALYLAGTLWAVLWIFGDILRHIRLFLLALVLAALVAASIAALSGWGFEASFPYLAGAIWVLLRIGVGIWGRPPTEEEHHVYARGIEGDSRHHSAAADGPSGELIARERSVAAHHRADDEWSAVARGSPEWVAQTETIRPTIRSPGATNKGLPRPTFITLQDIQQGSEEGRSHFFVPSKMRFGKAERVRYIVASPGQVMSATEKDVRVTPIMKATLSGRGFTIDLVSGTAERAVSLESPTTWEWDVTPTELGSLVLEVRLTGYVSLDGREAPTEFEADSRTVVVQIGTWGWMRKHHQHLQWGLGLLVALISVPFIADAVKTRAPASAGARAPASSPEAGPAQAASRRAPEVVRPAH